MTALISITEPRAGEEDVLAGIWHEAWHEAHAEIVSPGLVRARKLDAFVGRITANLGNTLVGRIDGAPVGPVSTKPEQLHQLFVAQAGRGKGIARDLILAAEARLAEQGAREAFLHCAVGNDRAAAVYRKMGWQDDGRIFEPIHADGGTYQVLCTIFRKQLVGLN